MQRRLMVWVNANHQPEEIYTTIRALSFMSEMQVFVENTGRLNRRLSVIVPKQQLEEQKKNHLVELTKKIRLDGFRPGKVPVHVIEKLYSESVWSEVVEKALSKSLALAFKEKALIPVNQPHIDSIKAEPGSDLEYKVSFEIYPEVPTPALNAKDIVFEKLKVEITEDDITHVLEKMCHQYGEWIEVQRKAQQGDKVSFDLVFSEDSEPRKALTLLIRGGEMPEGFESLFGSMAGETLNVLLPAADKEKQVDKTKAATVHVQKVFELKLPELNDDFAQRVGIKEGGIEAVRTQIRQHMQDNLDQVLGEKLKAQVLDKLIQTYAIEVLPQTLLDQELQRVEAELQEQRKQEGKSTDEPLSEEAKKNLQLTVNRRVTLGLLFKALIEAHQLQADEDRVTEEIEHLISFFQFESKMRNDLYKNEEMMRNIRSSVLEKQVIDKLLEGVNYTEKTIEYNELVHLSDETQAEGAEEITA